MRNATAWRTNCSMLVCSSKIKGWRLNNKEFNLEAINQFVERFQIEVAAVKNNTNGVGMRNALLLDTRKY